MASPEEPVTVTANQLVFSRIQALIKHNPLRAEQALIQTWSQHINI